MGAAGLPRSWSLPTLDGRGLGGVRLGPDAGRPALFVHGVPGSAENLRFLDLSGEAIERAGVAMVAIDRPGIGASAPLARPADSPSSAADAAADDMVSVLDAFGWARACIVVHSAGAYAGVTMAARYPERVARLVLVAPAAPDMRAPEAAGMDAGARGFFDLCRDGPGQATVVMRVMRAALAIAPGPATRAAARSLPPADRALLDDGRARRAFVAMIRRALSQGPRGVVADGRAAAGPWTVDAERIRCPIDLYAGDEDRNVPPPVAVAWTARLPGASVHREPHAGHVSILPLVAARVLASIGTDHEAPLAATRRTSASP